MPTLDELGQALKAADAAGDTANATVLAKAYAAAMQGGDSGSKPQAAAPPDITPEREYGLGARSLIEGMGGLADLPANILRLGPIAGEHIRQFAGTAVRDLAGDTIRKKMGLSVPGDPMPPPMEGDTGGASQAMSSAADILGLPKAETPGERVYAAGVRGAPAALMNPAAPIAGAVSGVAGNMAGQATAEAGAGKPAQFLASLVGGLGAAAGPALAKRATQGVLGINPANAQQNIENAAAAGVERPTLGMAAGPGSNAQVIESALSTVPGSAGVMRGSIERANKAAGQVVSDIADNLGAGRGPQSAGAMVQDSLTSKALPSISGSVTAAYKARAAAVPEGTTVDVSGTLYKIQEMAERDPMFAKYVEGSDLFKWLNSRLMLSTGQPGARQVTVGGQQAWLTPSGKLVSTPPPVTPGTKLSFDDADALQRGLNQLTDYSYLAGDITSIHNGNLAQTGKAAAQDIATALKPIPGASAADRYATKVYQEAVEEKGNLRAVLASGTPEKAFNAVMAGAKDGDTILSSVYRGLNVPEQNIMTGTLLRRMGLASPGAQNAAGDVWSPNTFLTNWNKLSPDARSTLFRNLPPSTKDNLDAFAAYAENIKKSSQIYANPSGTASREALVVAAGAAGVAGRALMTGHPAVAAAVIAPYVMAYGTAKAMTNPAVIRVLASSTKVPVAYVPILANQLIKIGQESNNPDASALGTGLLKANQGQ